MISIIDIISVLVIGYAFYNGYKRGFINIVFDFLAFSVSLLLSTKYYKAIGGFLERTIHIRVTWSNAMSWDNVMVWIITFLLFFIIFKLLGILITRLFKKTILGAWNQYAGMALHGLKWLVIVWLAIAIMLNLPFKNLKDYCAKAVVYKAYVILTELVPLEKMFPQKLQ